MGGPIPLGYKLGERKLLIDETEAAIVRMIFERYIALRSIGRLADELATANIRTKVRHYADGSRRGGALFHHGPLSWMLNNPVYIGKVAFKGELHEGEHEAIIDDQLWQQVQSVLTDNRRDKRLGKSVRSPSLLTGMLTDPEGRPMTPTFSSRGTQRHHYYVSRLKPGEDRKTSWRVPVGDIDKAVLGCVASWLRSKDRVTCGQHATALDAELQADAAIADALPLMSVPEQRAILLEQQVTSQLGDDRLLITIGEGSSTIDLPARLAHRGSELKLVIQADQAVAGKIDPVLVKLVLLAMAAQKALLSDEFDSLVSHYSKRHLWQLLRISWFAPDLLAAILDGRHPPTLTGRRLLRATDIPLEWIAQRQLFRAN